MAGKAGTERASGQSGLGCHAPFKIPGVPGSDVYDAAMVTRRANLSCRTALDRYVRSYDHRQYFSIPAPGWSPPARRP